VWLAQVERELTAVQTTADETEIARVLAERDAAQSTLDALVAEWDELQAG
jgi:hypothetical protein